MPCHRRRCAPCSSRCRARRSLRTTCTGARPSCATGGTSWSAVLGVVRLPVVCGPTAAGKSALALALAEARGMGIISADSRQVYRGFDIGTAKPTADERRRVRHEGIDVAEPTERYSAARWAAGVEEWRATLEAMG